MKQEISIQNITRSGKTISINASIQKFKIEVVTGLLESLETGENLNRNYIPDGAPLQYSLNVNIEHNDSEEMIQQRVKESIIKTYVEDQAMKRRGDKLRDACLALGTISIEVPEPAEISIHDGKFEGFIGMYTKYLRVVLFDGVKEIERIVTPNKYGHFSLVIEGHTVVSVTPVGQYGLLGEVQ